ncbi:hypothetical protein Ancab_003618 [Ancistrocladus abbreviatus]
MPNNSSGGYLALVNRDAWNDTSKNQFVAVEFDTSKNFWDPSSDHVGIDVNSIVSVANVSWNSSMKNGSTTNAWITYNSTKKNLSVFLTYADNPIFDGNSSLWYIIDFSKFLPNAVGIGFSAATGANVEIHNILTWSFNSTLEFGRKRETDLPRVTRCQLDVVDDFEKGTGPKRFSYIELRRLTNNFAEAGKLGEGGFGGVYWGMSTNPNIEVAVKRVSRSSKQGRKEYVSEVRIISRLRHRNLVQLIEWEQCVVHRDIKSSNIMLDSNFNAKLGDFGLARLVDHELGSQTTVLAGTMGYLSPECVIAGKASKESDVYSFSIVALEIACRRKPVQPNEEPGKVGLVEWVWDLYRKGLLIKAAGNSTSNK